MKRRKPLKRGPTILEREWWGRLRTIVWKRDRGVCQVCGSWTTITTAQAAHLHSLRAGRSRYKDQTCSLCERDLNHPDNLVTTCSSKCNDEAAAHWDKTVGCRRKEADD